VRLLGSRRDEILIFQRSKLLQTMHCDEWLILFIGQSIMSAINYRPGREVCGIANLLTIVCSHVGIEICGEVIISPE
jgi:hypothetical protein